MPGLWFLTDPARTPDPLGVAARLPRGSAVVYRSFGAADALSIACQLRRLTWRKGISLLIGADAALAAAARADGVHLPERMMALAPGLRRARPGWLITAAAHDRAAVAAAARLDLDAVLVSTVFDSPSPTAGAALGSVRFTAIAAASKTPVVALGGITAGTAQQLRHSPAVGLAAVSGLAAD